MNGFGMFARIAGGFSVGYMTSGLFFVHNIPATPLTLLLFCILSILLIVGILDLLLN
jgi:hypothetical protein